MTLDYICHARNYQQVLDWPQVQQTSRKLHVGIRCAAWPLPQRTIVGGRCARGHACWRWGMLQTCLRHRLRHLALPVCWLLWNCWWRSLQEYEYAYCWIMSPSLIVQSPESPVQCTSPGSFSDVFNKILCCTISVLNSCSKAVSINCACAIL